MSKKKTDWKHRLKEVFLGVGGISFLLWLFLAKLPITLPGPIPVDPPNAWFEWAFPDETPRGIVGIWFAEISGDHDWSRRNALMDAFRSEMSGASERVDIKEFQALITNHRKAKAAAQRVNASIVVWGRIGKLSDEETLSVFHTVIPRVDGYGPEQGPFMVAGVPKAGQIRPEEAAKQLKKVAKQLAAYTSVVQNDYARAADLYETLLSDFPVTKSEAVNFHFFAALSRQSLWETDKNNTKLFDVAKGHYEFVARNCRESPATALCANSRTNLGVLFLAKGESKMALRYHQEALPFAGEDKHQVLKNVAAIYAQMGNYLAAEKNYREALVLAPNSSRGALGLGGVLAAEGKFSEAEAAFRRAIELDPKDHRPYFLLGESLIKLGRVEEGLSYQRKAAQIAPDKVTIKRKE